MAGKFDLALIQARVSGGPAEATEAACARAREAARLGANVVLLQELFRTPYLCQEESAANFDLAEPVPGPSTEALGKIARETGAVIVAPVFERRAPGVYHNSAAVIGPEGGVLDVYRKMHIPDDPLYYEKYYFTPGDLGFRAVQTPFGRIGVLICWDQWFPEAARLTALAGAELLLYPTAIGWHPREKAEAGAAQLDSWRTAQRAHAIASGVWVAAANRVGREGAEGGGIEFWGHSFLCDPAGRVVAEAAHQEEAIVLGTVDLALVEKQRREWPFLRDRRIDAYEGLLKRWGK